MAKTEIFSRAALSLVCSHPTTPLSGQAVRFGELTGVAETDERADGTTSVNAEYGRVWDLPVIGHNGTANAAIAAGAKVYYDDVLATFEGVANTPILNSDATARLFGITLEAVSSGATTRVRVMKQ